MRKSKICRDKQSYYFLKILNLGIVMRMCKSMQNSEQVFLRFVK